MDETDSSSQLLPAASQGSERVRDELIEGLRSVAVEQQIRFCTADDGVRLAYASHGRGPAIVKVANWVTHVEFDWRSPLWRHWWKELGSGHRVIRYDIRGCGLSDRDPEELSFDAFVADLESVVDAAGIDRFALLGISQGGAVAVRYAVEHPERVTHLVLCGAYARGRLQRDLSTEQLEENELLQSIVRVGWGKPDPVFRRVFTSRFVPEASEEQMRWFDELMRVSTAPDMAVCLRSTWANVDVSDLLERVAVPALVAHARDEVAVPFEEGRLLATRIPGARFIPLESRNHVLLATEPAWQTFLREVRAFLGTPRQTTAQLDELSPREKDVLRLVAQGCSNAEVADGLFISVRTVERHLATRMPSSASPGGRPGPRLRRCSPAWRRERPAETEQYVEAAIPGPGDYVVPRMRTARTICHLHGMTYRILPFHRLLDPETASRDPSARLAPLVVATAAAQALLFVLTPTLVDIARNLGVPVEAAAQARALAALAAIAAAVVITPRIGRIGVPRLLRAGAATAVVACTTVALSRGIATFLVAHLIVGTAFAMLLSAGFAGVAAYPEGGRARAMGFIAAANASAAITINPIAGLLTEHLSWRAAEIVPGAVSVCALALSFRATPVAAKPGAPRLRAVLSNRSARTWIAAELSAYIAWTAFLTFNGAFFIERLGLGVGSAGWLLAVGPVAYAVAATRSGRLAERFPRTRIVATAAVAMSVLLGVLLVTTRAWPAAAVLCALIGGAAGLRTPTSSTVGIAQLPDQPGAMMATRTATTQLGYLLGAVVGGAVTAGAGYRGLGIVLALGLIVSAVLVMWVDEHPSAARVESGTADVPVGEDEKPGRNETGGHNTQCDDRNRIELSRG